MSIDRRGFLGFFACLPFVRKRRARPKPKPRLIDGILFKEEVTYGVIIINNAGLDTERIERRLRYLQDRDDAVGVRPFTRRGLE